MLTEAGHPDVKLCADEFRSLVAEHPRPGTLTLNTGMQAIACDKCSLASPKPFMPDLEPLTRGMPRALMQPKTVGLSTI
jgi:hypothetical protein